MRRLIRPLLAAALVALAVGLPNPAGAAGEVEVSLLAGQFVPVAVDVPSGADLTFVNKDVTNYPLVIGNHNVIPDPHASVMGFKAWPTSSALIEPGEKWTCKGGDKGLTCKGIDGKPTLVPPGSYGIACGLHPNQMHGHVVVK
jgi:plastocyanin